MEMRDRLARAVIPHLSYARESWDESDDYSRNWAHEIADEVIETLGLTREEVRVEPRAGSTTMFVPRTVERYVTPWERVDDA